MSESNSFRLCGPRGRGKIKDIYKIIKLQYRFLYCQNRYVVECVGQIFEGINRKLEFFWDKIMLNWGSKLVFPICLLSVMRFLHKGKKFITLPKAYRVKKCQKHFKFKVCFLVCCDIINNGLLIKKVDASLAGQIN